MTRLDDRTRRGARALRRQGDGHPLGDPRRLRRPGELPLRARRPGRARRRGGLRRRDLADQGAARRRGSSHRLRDRRAAGPVTGDRLLAGTASYLSVAPASRSSGASDRGRRRLAHPLADQRAPLSARLVDGRPAAPRIAQHNAGPACRSCIERSRARPRRLGPRPRPEMEERDEALGDRLRANKSFRW